MTEAEPIELHGTDVSVQSLSTPSAHTVDAHRASPSRVVCGHIKHVCVCRGDAFAGERVLARDAHMCM